MRTMRKTAAWSVGFFLTLSTLGAASPLSDLKVEYGCLGDRRPPCDPKYSESISYQRGAQAVGVTDPGSLGVSVVPARTGWRFR